MSKKCNPIGHMPHFFVEPHSGVTDETVPQTPAERTTFDTTAPSDPHHAGGPNASVNATRDSTHVHPERVHAHSHPLLHSTGEDHASPSSETRRYTLRIAPASLSGETSTSNVPPTPVSPRALRRSTRSGGHFSVSEDRDDDAHEGMGDLLMEGGMSFGVATGHLLAPYFQIEEPCAQESEHDDEGEEDS
ncbi:hypothetical protein DICSQDRAFT_173207 [Dichomitus squalens LYAD-421 SS1]|uniref:Uncharacterized protein n=1 Tax=Dichomitus squalens (strain LYAD-421) TaxID=732165 RepID=R7SQR0_DICSQ|nr:uncharacterized protein DICSQDRAFT_173207 [Dichomitus squalens LYAD-421 SS1]EJF58253.1 hypothetical protein DICSQDRAFT_173207 [Dichomitus squalens LYAD-421 SS1]